ncbi:hypothetical protein [Actinomadura logoneensis]|uniref:hypothetical protein n=1 Tax=Actinomadura logoneensis TaxID=2293572 RepID=UPI0011C16427|nr:hypothetical protein [Actinomadura logoneensis]
MSWSEPKMKRLVHVHGFLEALPRLMECSEPGVASLKQMSAFTAVTLADVQQKSRFEKLKHGQASC